MVKYVFLLIALLLNPLYSQQSGDLQKIKKEINELENQLQKSKSKLKNEVSTLNTYDKKINLVKKAVKIMDKDINRFKGEMTDLEKSLLSEQSKIDTLTKIIEHQTLLLYLKGITNEKSRWWRWFAWQEDARQKKYASFLLDYEQKLAKSIEEKMTNIKTMKEQKVELVTRLETTKKDKSKESRKLASGYKEKKSLINKIKNDQKLLAGSIKHKKESYEKLKKYLAELETKRMARTTGVKTTATVSWEKLSGSFPKLKGKLNWPVTGKIISPFGRHKDKKYKIVAINNGIDIKAKKGTSVRAVHDGMVVKVTYMGGFGNTVIVDHNDGYYTVYSHLDEITTSENTYATSGQVLGSVGDSGSLDGAKLHFEIYTKNKPTNPEKWLK